MNKNIEIFTKKYNKKGTFIREIRSFVLRRKKNNKFYIELFKIYWYFCGIDFLYKNIFFQSYFKNTNPVILDIGFGYGNSLLKTAIKNSKKNYLGVEVYFPGIFYSVQKIFFLKLKNIKIIYRDVTEVIKYMIPNNTIYKIQIFFPDPWKKRKHNKRRLLQYSFLKKLSKKVQSGGFLHITTDDESYSTFILKNSKNISCLYDVSKNEFIKNKIIDRPITKFEKKSISQGRKIFDLLFIKK
ncbi:tRNA (guanosine(46)-N7)-methyltransferase TrmB [Buchnera aphidicola (Kurisakia onigurumii)]|uniref:tRNA (guanosine(46)-N7)-methyltransferase TrmB n=1 Tax=Buchnera aphidicola TaxID=9 RepID=UPI0031B6F9FF